MSISQEPRAHRSVLGVLLAAGILAASCDGTTKAAPTVPSVVYGAGDLGEVACQPSRPTKICTGLLPVPRGVTDQIILDRSTVPAGRSITGDLVVRNMSGSVLDLRDRNGCQPPSAVVLTNEHLDAGAGFDRMCRSDPLVIPTGTTCFPVQVITTYTMGTQDSASRPAGSTIQTCTTTGPPPLPPGSYHAVLIGEQVALPPATVAVTLTASR